MRILEIDEVAYLMGLSWHTASGPGVRRDMNSFVASEGFSYGVVHIYDSDEGVDRNAIDQLTGIKPGKGYQVGATDDEDSKGLISLASLIAKMTVATGLYCLTINEGKKWILAVNGGEVVSSTDCELDDDSAREVLSELFEALVGTHSGDTPFVCIVDDDNFLDVFSEHDESFVEHISESGKILMSGLLDGDSDSFAKASKVSSLDNKGGIKLISALAILGGGYYVYGEYNENKEAQEVMRQQMDRVVHQKKPEGPSQEEILSEARRDEISDFNSFFSSHSNIEFIEKAISLIRTTPRVISGWEPQVLEASVSEVSIVWESTGGTPLGILRYLNNEFDSHNFNDRASAVVSTISLDERVRDGYIDIYAMLPGNDQRLRLIDKLQRKGGTWTLGSSVVTRRSQPIPGILNPELSRVRQAPYRQSDIKVSGDGLHMLRSYYEIFDDNSFVRITKVRIDFSNYKWEVEGIYYERN